MRRFLKVSACTYFAVLAICGTMVRADENAGFAQSVQKIESDIAAAKAKGVGTGPYEAALKSIQTDKITGIADDDLQKRLDSLSQNLTQQLARSGALKNRILQKTSSQSASTSTASGSDSASAPSSDDRFDINSFVYTVKGTHLTGEVDAAFIAEVKDEINKLPVKLLTELQKRGGRVCITPRIIDKMPGYQNTKPRGWDEGRTGKNVDGLFDGKDVIVCEYSSSYADDGVLTKSHRVPYIIKHESGHAFDHYWGSITETPEFKHTYFLELAKMDPDQKDSDLRYFAQKAEGGPSECFAELFAVMNGGGSSKAVNENMPLIFPNTSKFIRRTLGF